MLSLADNISDTESIADSEAEGEELDEGSIKDSDLLSSLLATEAETKQNTCLAKKKANKTDLQKRASLLDEIFDYIHVAQCRRLFSFAWYDDMTYAANEDLETPIKALPVTSCNSPGYQSNEPKLLKRKLFIETLPIKFSKFDREWFTFCTLALKKWRRKTSIRL